MPNPRLLRLLSPQTFCVCDNFISSDSTDIFSSVSTKLVANRVTTISYHEEYSWSVHGRHGLHFLPDLPCCEIRPNVALGSLACLRKMSAYDHRTMYPSALIQILLFCIKNINQIIPNLLEVDTKPRQATLSETMQCFSLTPYWRLILTGQIFMLLPFWRKVVENYWHPGYPPRAFWTLSSTTRRTAIICG